MSAPATRLQDIEAEIAGLRDQADADAVKRRGRLRDLGRAFAIGGGTEDLSGLLAEDLERVKDEAARFLKGRAAFTAQSKLPAAEAALAAEQEQAKARAAEIDREIARLADEKRNLGGEARRLSLAVGALQVEAGHLQAFLDPAETAWRSSRTKALEAARGRVRDATRELESRPSRITRLRNQVAELTGLISRTHPNEGQSWLEGLRRKQGCLSGELATLESADNSELRKVVADAEAEAAAIEAELAAHQVELARWFGVE